MSKDRANRYSSVVDFTAALAKTKEQWQDEGDAHFEAERYEEALMAFELAIRLDPNLATAYSSKGVVLNELKRYEDALVAYEQVIRLDPNGALAYYHKSLTLDQLGRKAEAQQAYALARQLGYEG